MEDSSLVTIWKFIIVGVVLVVGIIAGATSYYNHQFVAGGYCETSLPGQNSRAWVKCGTK